MWPRYTLHSSEKTKSRSIRIVTSYDVSPTGQQWKGMASEPSSNMSISRHIYIYIYVCVANHVHVDIVKRRITCLDGLLLPTTWKLTPSWPPGSGSLKSAWDAWHGRTIGGTGLHDPTPGRRQSSPNIDNWTIPCTILAANAFGPIQTRTHLVWVRWDTSW